MSLSELMDALRPSPGEESTCTIEVPAAWQQGRTLFGGASLALAGATARALEPVVGALGPLRCAQVAFLAPATGVLELHARVLRAGRAVTFVGVDTTAQGALAARSILTFGHPREGALSHGSLSAPEVPDPDSCPEVPRVEGAAPPFLDQLDLRQAGGSDLLDPGAPEFLMWTRHRDAGALRAESALLAAADVLPPAVLALAEGFRPASSITWTLDLVAELPPPEGWFLLEQHR
jgi:hypothetical protein